jgi:hypothetical protein
MTPQETKQIQDAVTTGLSHFCVEEIIVPKLERAITAALQRNDPWRPALHFLAGLAAFCLAVVVGVFNAFPADATVMDALERQALGGVLAWISLAAFVATLAGGFGQLMRWRYRDNQQGMVHRWGPGICMLVPALFGLGAVSYCVRWGVAALTDPSQDLGFRAALTELFCRLF